MLTVDLTWNDFKLLVNGVSKSLPAQAVQDSGKYFLMAKDDFVVYTCTTELDNAEFLACFNLFNTQIDGSREVYIRQQRKTNGHYLYQPICFDVAPNKATYFDYVVKDFTHGVDWLSTVLNCRDLDSGDKIVTAKAFGGTFGGLAAVDGNVVTLASPTGYLLSPTAQGGILDEGYYLSFGEETSTVEELNEATITDYANPSPEKKEYQIKRIGSAIIAGDGSGTVEVTLFSTPSGITPGDAVNLVMRAVDEALEVTEGDVIDVGGQALTSGNIPGNKRLRFGYYNSTGVTKRVRARLALLY